MIRLIHIKEALRMFKRRKNFKGFKKYKGNAKEICRQCVDACWNGNYFQTSTGHFTGFYCRDFGKSVESLMSLGYEKEVRKTLEYVLNKFEKNNAITVSVSPDGKCFDFPNISPDSLAYILHSLKVLNDEKLINKYEKFLKKEIRRYYNITINKKTGLVKRKTFSEMRDYSKRKSSFYNNVMSHWIYGLCKTLRLRSPYKNIKQKLKDEFWNGDYFYEDLNKKPIVTGDSNTIPFITNIFTDKQMIKKAINSIKQSELDKPFPLKYSKLEEANLILLHFFANGYETDSIWSWLGIAYMKMLKKVNKKEFKKVYNFYSNLIEKQGTFLELFDKNGNIFITPFYVSDEGMIWASMFANL